MNDCSKTQVPNGGGSAHQWALGTSCRPLDNRTSEFIGHAHVIKNFNINIFINYLKFS